MVRARCQFPSFFIDEFFGKWLNVVLVCLVWFRQRDEKMSMICLGDFREMPNFVETNPQAGKTDVRGSVLWRRQFRVGWGGAKTECKMNMLDNPLVWLMRIRHRCGYGVHSPFAFRFLTDVVYERTPYYAYSTLDASLPLAYSMRRQKGLHLMFRIANWLQPAVAVVPQEVCHERRYLQAGCRHALVMAHAPACGADLIVLREPDEQAAQMVRAGGVLILDNLQQHREWFCRLPATVTFDLYDLGVAIYEERLTKQHYIINF